jgi:hypothetical protein
MAFIVLLALGVGLTIYMIYNNIKQKKAKEYSDPSVDIAPSLLSDTPEDDMNVDYGTLSTPKIGLTSESNDRGYILDPKSSFPLTIYNVNQDITTKIRGLLEKGYLQGYNEVTQDLVPIIAQYNVKCKEVDDYVKKFNPQYQKRIKEQIEASTEWNDLSDIDRTNLLLEFKANAIDSLDIKPNCDNLALLFDIKESDLVLEDEFIRKIGYDTLYFYLKKKKDIYRAPADHIDRKRFEDLAEAGLAVRGKDIPLETILTSLKLKELYSLVQDLNPPKFSRREKAIEYLQSVQDLSSRIESVIGFESFFLVQELPKDLKGIDMDKVSLSLRYFEELSAIIGETYLRSGHAFSGISTQKGYSKMGLTKGMKIEIIDDERCCPYCKRIASQTYSKGQYPKTPMHIGCRCTIVPIYENEE